MTFRTHNITKVLTSAALMAALLQSCFTGIESTPKISANDVKKRSATILSAEQTFLSHILPQPPIEWAKGKAFYVTDDKIAIIFSLNENEAANLTGKNIIFQEFAEAPSITGKGATFAVFATPDGSAKMNYRIDYPLKDIVQRNRLEIPFTVEQSVIHGADSLMAGRTFFISTPKWVDAVTGKTVIGQRHVPVKVSSVGPGTYIYPLRVYFKPTNGTGEFFIPMSIGSDKSATRNFSTVFNFENPRLKFPQISDETWELIINSRVATGMTRDECRLALGAPNSYRTIPVTNAIVEQWSYDDGLYLIFEDGILTRFRI